MDSNPEGEAKLVYSIYNPAEVVITKQISSLPLHTQYNTLFFQTFVG